MSDFCPDGYVPTQDAIMKAVEHWFPVQFNQFVVAMESQPARRLNNLGNSFGSTLNSMTNPTGESNLMTDTPSRRKRLSLPFERWPEADRIASDAAWQPATRLKRGGAAGHLKPVTREDHVRTYGDFLGFLDRRGLLRREETAAANVTATNVEAYLIELKSRMRSTTIHACMWRLRRTARYMVPGLELEWLAEIAKDLALVAHPRSKSDRWVLPERLIEAGLALIQEAENSHTMSKLAQARQVRNGLMQATLGFHPIRRKNFTALEIGRSFVKIRGKWWIILSAAETKEGRADHRRVNKLLIPFIEQYLREYRPVLARSENPPSALWLSNNDGTPITAQQAARVIGTTTLSTVGVKVSPHLFRTAAGSAAAAYCGDNPHLGSAVLHHSDPRVTEEHYNRATSLSAAESFRQIVRQYEKR
jgi:site-specific recombinase XerD